MTRFCQLCAPLLSVNQLIPDVYLCVAESSFSRRHLLDATANADSTAISNGGNANANSDATAISNGAGNANANADATAGTARETAGLQALYNYLS